MHVREKGKLDELRAALELATEEELQDLTAILFSRKFNPLDYLQTPEPVEVQSQNRQAWLDTIEERFCFLAADGMTVLRGKSQQITYREALVGVCKYLKIPYSDDLTTVDLEAEVLYMGYNCCRYGYCRQKTGRRMDIPSPSEESSWLRARRS